MTAWEHRDGRYDHAPQPHYNSNGKPAWWTCDFQTGKGRWDKCDEPLLLDGKRPPIATVAAGTEQDESAMSAQP